MFRRNASILASVFLLAFWSGAAAADSAAALGSGDLQDANIGSGAQVNAIGWSDMGDVNAGGNQLTGGGANSNGGDRTSRDLVLNLGGMPTVASAAVTVVPTSIPITRAAACPNSSAPSVPEHGPDELER